MNQSTPVETHQNWRSLYLLGAIAGIAMLAIMVAQIAIFMIAPPPTTVDGFFSLFQDNWLLGLLSMDLLYLVNNAVMVLIYLAIYMSLRRHAETAMLVSLVLALVGITAYYASNTAFEMLALSHQFAAVTSEVQRTALLGAGEAALAIYRGTAFDSYYVLNAAALLIFAFVMLRSKDFPRAAAILAIVSGIFMIIPSTAGTIGLVFSLLSLIPWAAFLVFAIRVFFRLAKKPIG